MGAPTWFSLGACLPPNSAWPWMGEKEAGWCHWGWLITKLIVDIVRPWRKSELGERKREKKRFKNRRGWRDNCTGIKALALHAADLCSVPDYAYGPLNYAGWPENR